MMEDRFSPLMETKTFRAEHWRKSSQWFMLTRRQAGLQAASQQCGRIGTGMRRLVVNWGTRGS